ncbi:MAG: alpha/beta hydrolase-fold protein [Pirellulales bacterium]|nr:alpha/beta hydrolase-fold protein [Pirellulales bacterium]
MDHSGNWSRVVIAGHPCELYQPVRSVPGRGMIYLHGVHMQKLSGYPAFAAELDRHGLPCLCPETGRSWWTDRPCLEFDPHLTAERYLLNHVLPWLEQERGIRPPGIGLWGTSMGGQGALRLAFKHPARFPVVAGISPAIDYWLRMKDDYGDPLWQMYPDPEAARQDSATLHVHPLNWPRNIWFCCDPVDLRWHESADRLRMKLAALGIPQKYDLETTGGGHSFEYYSRMARPALDFVAAALDQESRRVA